MKRKNSNVNGRVYHAMRFLAIILYVPVGGLAYVMLLFFSVLLGVMWAFAWILVPMLIWLLELEGKSLSGLVASAITALYTYSRPPHARNKVEQDDD